MSPAAGAGGSSSSTANAGAGGSTTATTNGTGSGNAKSPSRLAANPFMQANEKTEKRVPNVAGVKNPNARVYKDNK